MAGLVGYFWVPWSPQWQPCTVRFPSPMRGVVHGKGGQFKRKEVGEDRESVPGDVPGPPPPPEGLQLPSLEGLAGVTIEVVTSRVKENRHRGARSAGRGNVNKYRTRVAFRVHDSTSGAVQSVTYDSRPDLEAAITRLRVARGVALGGGAAAAGIAGAGAPAGGSPGGAGSGTGVPPPRKKFASPFIMVSTAALEATMTSHCSCGAQGERGSGAHGEGTDPCSGVCATAHTRLPLSPPPLHTSQQALTPTARARFQKK